MNLFLLLVLFLFGFGIFGASSSGTSSGGGTSGSSTGTVQVQAAPVITLADSGRTVKLRRGEEAVIQLPDRWIWAEPETTGRAVELGTISSYRDTGFTAWSALGVRRGAWTFRTTGKPGGKRFAITVRVR